MKVIPKKTLKKVFRTLLLVCINCSCLCFVLWQIIQCFQKYIDKPHGTSLSIENATDVPFPAITVCGSFVNDVDMKWFNETYLFDICGLSLMDYTTFGKWTSQKPNCLDGNDLFEKIVLKSTDVLNHVGFHYRSTSKTEHYWASHGQIDGSIPIWDKSNDSVWLRYQDSFSNGRCFTIMPTHEQIKKGIEQIELEIGKKSLVFLHTPGMFIAYPKSKFTFWGDALRLYFTANVDKKYLWSVNYKYHKMLECNDDAGYCKDFCIDEAVAKKCFSKFGCTTPFGSNKNQVCTDNEGGGDISNTNALYIYQEMYSRSVVEGCTNPCSMFTFKTKTNGFHSEDTGGQFGFGFGPPSSTVNLNFEEVISVSEDYYVYSAISLIAETGGYVGLFLGVSVNQLFDLIDFILEKIA